MRFQDRLSHDKATSISPASRRQSRDRRAADAFDPVTACNFRSILFLLLATCLLQSALWAQPAEVLVSAPLVTVGDDWLLDTDEAHDALTFNITLALVRNQPEPEAEAREIPVRFIVRLVESGAVAAPVGSISHTETFNVEPMDVVLVSVDLEITPNQILSQATTYDLHIGISHDDDPPSGSFENDQSVVHGPHSLVHFSGDLSFGSIETTMSAFALPPFDIPVTNGNGWRLRISQGTLSIGIPYANQAPPSTSVVDVQRNDSDGSAQVLFGSVLVSPPDQIIEINGWNVELGDVLLDINGIQAQDFTLDLPEGSGWRLDDSDTTTAQTLNPVFSSEGVPLQLDEEIQPIEPPAGDFAGAHEYVEERQAIGYVGLSWIWDFQMLIINQPQTRFLRQWHYDQWQEVEGTLPDANDGYLDQLAPNPEGDLLISPGLNGGFNVELTINSGAFSPHFPQGSVSHDGGPLQLVDGLPDSTASALSAAVTTVVTSLGCDSAEDPPEVLEPPEWEAVRVGPQLLRFTAQGSLWTEGEPQPDPNPSGGLSIVQRAAAGLDEGNQQPVHETSTYANQDVQILIPGPVVPAADGSDRDDDANNTVDEPGEHPNEFNPARWLYTGLRAQEDDLLEHPATGDYLAGEGDYAGVNFRHFSGLTGISRVGGSLMGPYGLDSCNKVYTRTSGTTGRWVAVDNTLPPTIEVGGPEPFTLTLDNWAFQLLDNEPQFEHNAVAGSVTLDHPAGFSLAFDSLDFNCCGNLENLSLAEGESIQSMAYWRQALIAVQSARFVSSSPCSMENACLELHVRARANGFPEDLDGILCFYGDGTLTNDLDESLPSSLLHVGPGAFAGDYRLEPVRHAYYNTPDDQPAGEEEPEDDGIISVAGLLDLPFFRAMEAHALLSGMDLPEESDPNIILGLLGGWDPALFENAHFDAEHRGLPPNFSPDDYADSTDPELLPRAERTWFGVVPFDFPVFYDPPTGYFHSVQRQQINVIVANAEAEVPRLNHEEAAIDFGITVGLSLNSLLSEALEFASGELAEGFLDLAIAPHFQNIGQGLDSLDGLLSLQARDALGDVEVPELDEIIVAAAGQVAAGADVEIDFEDVLETHLATAVGDFVAGEGGQLEPIVTGLNGMRQFIEPGEETQLGEFIQQAMGFLDLPPGLDSLSVTELIELAELEGGPTRERLEELRARMQELLDLVQDVTGLNAELTEILSDEDEFEGLENGVNTALADYFEMVLADPDSFTQAEIESRIRTEIEDRLWALPVIGEVQTELRSRFYHFDHLIKQVLSSALDQLNRAIVDIVSEAVDLDGPLAELTGIGNYVQAVSLKGEAVITGDDLTYLSLKGHTVIHTEPIPLAFDPFYEYQQLHADGAGSACNQEVEPAVTNRITMGATVAPARMPLGEVSVTISTQFSFTENGQVIGFMGGFETLAEGLSMQPVNMDRLNAMLNIGGNHESFGPDSFEFYVAGEGNATLFGSASPVQLPFSNFQLHGGLFAGRTCSSDPYAAWAPDLPLTPPFVGAIASVDGKFPFYDVGCMARLKASAGAGAYGVAQENVQDFTTLDFAVGAFVEGGVNGDFLCLVSGSGSIRLLGQATPQEATLDGTIEASLKVGPCPFCLKVNPNFGVHMSTQSGVSVDF